MSMYAYTYSHVYVRIHIFGYPAADSMSLEDVKNEDALLRMSRHSVLR